MRDAIVWVLFWLMTLVPTSGANLASPTPGPVRLMKDINTILSIDSGSFPETLRSSRLGPQSPVERCHFSCKWLRTKGQRAIT
jgi:hypothetical protein